MKFAKYKTTMTYFMGYFLFFLVLGVIVLLLGGNSNPLSDLLPTDNLGIEIIFLFCIFYPISAIVGVLLGTGFSPVLLKLHKLLIGRKCEYGIDDRPEEEKFSKPFRNFFPALMAINFALTFASIEQIAVVLAYDGSSTSAFMVLPIFTIGVATFLFSAVWSLSDAGIIYSTKNKVAGRDKPMEVRSVGGFYMYLLKGYAGISVILSFYQFFSTEFTANLESGAQIGDLASIVVVLLPFPVFATFASIPCVVIADIIRRTRIQYVRKWARLDGIKDIFEVEVKVAEPSS